MHFKPIDVEKLVRAFAQFMDVIGIKSSGGRVMLGTECFIGVFLLLGLGLVFGHEIYASLYSWARGVEFTFQSDRNFMLFALIMGFSLVLVFVREVIQELGRSPQQPGS